MGTIFYTPATDFSSELEENLMIFLFSWAGLFSFIIAAPHV